MWIGLCGVRDVNSVRGVDIVACDGDRCVWRAWCALGVRDVNTCVFVYECDTCINSNTNNV